MSVLDRIAQGTKTNIIRSGIGGYEAGNRSRLADIANTRNDATFQAKLSQLYQQGQKDAALAKKADDEATLDRKKAHNHAVYNFTQGALSFEDPQQIRGFIQKQAPQLIADKVLSQDELNGILQADDNGLKQGLEYLRANTDGYIKTLEDKKPPTYNTTEVGAGDGRLQRILYNSQDPTDTKNLGQPYPRSSSGVDRGPGGLKPNEYRAIINDMGKMIGRAFGGDGIWDPATGEFVLKDTASAAKAQAIHHKALELWQTKYENKYTKWENAVTDALQEYGIKMPDASGNQPPPGTGAKSGNVGARIDAYVQSMNKGNP